MGGQSKRKEPGKAQNLLVHKQVPGDLTHNGPLIDIYSIQEGSGWQISGVSCSGLFLSLDSLSLFIELHIF